MRKKILAALTALTLIISVLPAAAAAASAEDTPPEQVIRLDPANASPFNNGEFEGWGTSMGWWGNRIGYSDVLAQSAAELFYSEEGLGLDIVRYNVGGGDDPTHDHVTRSDSKLPCFAVPRYNEDGSFATDANGDVVYDYDWDADCNQVNVLKEIKKRNDDVHIEGYTNSPPWFMTVSGCSGGGVNEGDENLSPDNYDIFADFLADVAEHMDSIGLTFDSYSPMNEPNPASKYWTALNAKQEGNLVAQGEHQSGIITAVRDAFDAKNIDALVAGMDETSLKYSVSSYNALTDEAKSALGRFDTHSYSDRSAANFASLKQTAIDSGKNFWMSEVDNGGTAGTNAGNMSSALNLANFIIADMNGMQPSAWVMWDILDVHKDSEFQAPNGTYTEADNSLNQSGGLWGVGMVNHDAQEIELTQKYYGYGQFTRYIQPGMTIIGSADNSLAAYNKDTGEIVIVAVNTGGTDKTTEFDLRAFAKTGSQARVIRTSGAMDGGERWARLDPIDVKDKKFTAALKANSITTFVIGEDAAVNKFEPSEEEVSYKYTVSSAFLGYDKYFAVYDNNGALKTITRNKDEDTIAGDFTGCTYKLIIWDRMTPVTDDINTSSDLEPLNYMDISGSSTIISGVGYAYSVVSDMELTDDMITWSVSDDDMAEIITDGEGGGCTVTAKTGGTFTLTAALADGTYTAVDITALSSEQSVTITNKKSGLALETKSKGITSGTQLVQWEYRGLDTSAWGLSATNDGYFNIVNRNAGMLLASNAESKPVISDEVEVTDDAAKWELINHGGYYEIKNKSVGKSLNVSGQSIANGGSVILYSYAGGDNELWLLNEIDGELEHVIPVETDYSEKYNNTEYVFVSNVSAATNNFDDGELNGFVISGSAALTTDGSGEAVLGVQSKYSNSNGASETGSAALEADITCEDNQMINIAFDLYCSNSGGTADFVLYGTDGTELIKMEYSNWDDYAMTVAGTTTTETGLAKTYLRNNVNDGTGNQLIANGAHIEIYYTPSTGAIKLTLVNNTNSSAMKTYEGTADKGTNITELVFNADYTTWSKPMYMDNLVTNIIKVNTEE